MRTANQCLGIVLAAAFVGSLSTAWAQDATTTPQTTVPGQAPSNQTDTSSPLTPPENPNTATPLTPTPPVPGTPTATNTSGSSSETPPAFIQAPLERIRLDPSAPSDLALIIDPGSQQSLLNTDSISLQPLSLFPEAPGVPLNSLERTTMNGSTVGSSTRLSTRPTSFYPAKILGPTSTSGFSPSVSGFTSQTTTNTTLPGSSSTSMAPLVGSAAVDRVSSGEVTSASQMTTIAAPMPTRSLRSSARDFGSARFPSNVSRPSFDAHTRVSFGRSMGGGHH